MTIIQALSRAVQQLRKARIDSPNLDAEVLLARVLRQNRTFLFTHPEKKLGPAQIIFLKKLVGRRKKHEPIAYITGMKYFFKIPIQVNKKVLIPRPESELLVSLALEMLASEKNKCTVMDVGTGSGAVIIALAKNFKKAKFVGTDISKSALDLAKKNAKKQNARIIFNKMDLIKGFDKKFFKQNQNILMTANLPYLPTKIWNEAPIDVKKFEPKNALDGGTDGLKYYKELIGQLKNILPQVKSFHAFWEIDPDQESKLKILLKKIRAKNIRTYPDLCGRTRVIAWEK